MHDLDTVNSFCGFDLLKELWVGDTYPGDFYHDLLPTIRSAWQKITDLTKEDLGNLQDILESLGVTVHCVTCDIRREGHKRDMSPQRPDQHYLDWL